ncbi:tetratricopeptide repeat protein [Microbispora bryophytorum]|uniref:Tetratricopeptide repeat protein n=1 Tax=Microbispora bryophytorum subsp. camponoti TaxID=1677852 RepID=A0ABR8L7R7_9ACTN|nr:tetratricopeptide repeat protein [Microbispora camponoti]MBD3145615.1 tetratricopeptide repeat protein [Microbispora camponoti]
MIEGRNEASAFSNDPGGTPSGGVYEWFKRGTKLLEEGSPAAAAAILEHAVQAEPDSPSIREALARAQFNSKRYDEAAGSFRWIVDANPAEDYAYFGLGLSLWRSGDVEGAQEPLAVAVAMRPDLRHYVSALKQVRATLRARQA